MGKTRSELREKAMVILYQMDILKNNNVEFTVENLIAENLEVDNEFVRNIVYGVITHIESLDELADKYMKDWTINRIDKTTLTNIKTTQKTNFFQLKPDKSSSG